MSDTDNNKSGLADAIDTLQSQFTSGLADAQNLAKQAVLMSLGAYDRTMEEFNIARIKLEDRVAQLNEEASTLFAELVDRGDKVQEDVKVRYEEQRIDIEEQVDALKAKLAELGDKAGLAEGLDVIAAKLEDLSKRWSNLA